MKNERSLKFWAVAAMILAGFVFVAAALQDPMPLAQSRPKPDKICPITFHLDPATSLQKNFAAHIEKTNADLAKKLVELRVLLSHPNKENLKTELADFASTCKTDFEGTYLKNPVLWGDDGKTYPGWGAIVNYLGAIMPSTTYLGVQSVHVYLEYLPINSNLHKMYNKGIYVTPTWDLKGPKDLEGEIDFLASIRTVIAYAPYDDPMEIGNAAPIPHRKICDPIY